MTFIKTIIPMINDGRKYAELLAHELCSVQPMASACGIPFRMVMSDKSNYLELKWKDFCIGVIDLGELLKGYTLLETTFEKVEDKFNQERDYRIGKKQKYLTTTGKWRNRTIKAKEVPSHMDHKKYIDFKAKFQEGDKLVYYRSSESSWMCLAGREGLSIIRNGERIDSYGLSMS